MEIPNFLKEKLLEQYDNATVKNIIEGLNKRRTLDDKEVIFDKKMIVTLRVNTIKSNKEEIKEVLSKENIKFQEVNWYKDAFIIEDVKEEEIKKLDIYEQGKIYLQSLSSMIPPIILNPQENENILDMCSAPGGKTTQMVALSKDKAYITACERNKIRAEKLKYNLQKQGASRVNLMLTDARDLNDFLKFDKILLDAPCSGSGTENSFKKNFTKELIEKSSKTQETLLRKALKILKPGGEIVYSTCSILKEENENILEKVLKNTNCKLEKIELPKEIPLLPSKLKEVAVIAPNELFEGFFIAKIKT